MLNGVINQFRRIGYDDGRNDRDFSKQERALSIARKNLDEAIHAFNKAAQDLHDALLSSKPPPFH